MLKQQLAKCTLDRNYVQLERDTIQMFYDITKSEAWRRRPFECQVVTHVRKSACFKRG